MLRDSTLFQFSNALYPNRMRPIPSPVSASEIAPEVIKKMGYNLIHTDTGWIGLDYRNNYITIVTVQAKIGRVLEWQSGEIISQ